MSVTSADHHVEAIIDLLQAADSSDWQHGVPSIRPFWEDTQQEKGPGADQPAIIYVWSPVDSSLERFSMDQTNLEVTNTVEAQVWSLDDQEAVDYLNDTIQVITNYLDDNKVQTPFADVQPSAASDFRAQNNARVTQHYILSVEVDTTGLISTALV
jgi:hypothetical protein